MSVSHPPSFERAFPRRELLRGPARAAVIWSALAAVLLVILLADVFLIADLLETQGRLPGPLPTGEASRLAELAGAEIESIDPARTEDRGLLPTVWRSRDASWGPAVAAAWRAVPWLRENSTALVLLILVGVAAGGLRGVLLSRARRLSARTATDVVTRLRRTLHRQALRLGPGDLRDLDGGHALGLFTTDADRVRDGIERYVSRLARFPFELTLLAGLALLIHWRVALLCLIPLGFCWYLVQRERRRGETARRAAEDRARDRLKLLAEGFQKTRIVRGYGMEEFEHEQFRIHLDRYSSGVLSIQRVERWSRRLCWGLVTVCAAIVLLLVGIKILQSPGELNGLGGLSFSAALVLLATFALMHRPLDALWQLPAERDEASQAADRIYRYLGQIPDVSQAVGARFLQPMSKSIQFESVVYRLPDGRKPLDGLDLKLSAGETIAIVSLDALEPKALAYLLPRFIEPHAGRVLFDGEDIAWITLESLRAESAYVGGTDPFFTGTVFQNISCGSTSYSLQAVTEAAKLVHAHHFVLKLPLGYETVLGEHGERLDAGEGFRLGLARAVLRNPALMIIEEPSVDLDDDAKALLDDAYGRITKDRTVLFLPSRLSTVRRADTIVLLHRGKVAAVGKHATLVKTSPLYRHWEYIRFNEFRHEAPAVEARGVETSTARRVEESGKSVVSG